MPKTQGIVAAHFSQTEIAFLNISSLDCRAESSRIVLARWAISVSDVVIAPPPKHGMFFPSAKLNRPISPKVPTAFPPTRTPQACAQSSSKRIPRCCVNALISLIGQGFPNRWVANTAPVLAVILGSICSGPELKVTGSTSQNTGRNPSILATIGMTGKVKMGNMISAPFFNPREFNAS